MMRRLCHLAAAILLPLCLLGCATQSAVSYRLPDIDPEEGDRILVLPLLDARTLRHAQDPLGERVPERARKVLVQTMRQTPAFARKTFIVPSLKRPAKSYPLHEILEFGERFNADLVVAGQVFSFFDTGPTTVPPRAGYFLRIVSVPRGRTVFAGEDYKAATAPAASGGRELQARLAAQSLLKQYLGTAGVQGGTLLTPTPDEDAPTVLVLPYHQRENPLHLIETVGGGAVVTSLYRMELARAGGVRVIEPEANAVGHSTLPDPEAALEVARKHDADYVVRGQVVEFRRAISEPNAWGSFFSPTVLAARFIVADVSGVDIATELYRVADGACILARRDRSHQKYVVRAENTVRVLAQRTAPVMAALMQTEEAATVEPIIESIELPPATPRSGAAGEEEEAPADAPAEEEDE